VLLSMRMATNQDQIASSVLEFVKTLSPLTLHKKYVFLFSRASSYTCRVGTIGTIP
jgi:hypothetical protein